MFTVMITTKMKPEMMGGIMGKIHEITAKGMDESDFPPGLIEAISLVDSSESTISKLLFWESEEDFNNMMKSEKVQGVLHTQEHLFAGPPVIETFDMTIRASRSFAGVM